MLTQNLHKEYLVLKNSRGTVEKKSVAFDSFLRLFLFGVIFFQHISQAKDLHSFDVSNQSEESRGIREARNFEVEKRVRAESSCPDHLIGKINNDANSQMRNWNLTKAGSYDDYCAKSVRNLAELPNSRELSKKLSMNNLTSLGENQERLNEQCLNYINDHERKNFFVAEYYSNMARLKVSALGSLESLQAIDSVLGESSLYDQSCSSLVHKVAQSECNKLKACKPQGGLDKQVKELEEIYPEYENLKKEVDALRSQINSSVLVMGPGTIPHPATISENSERDNKIKEKKKQIEFIEAMYPPLKGKVFNSTFDLSKKNFKQALDNQLKETRKVISSDLKELQGATDCMNGHVSMCGNFDKTLRKLPPLDIKAFNNGASLTQEDGQVQAYLVAADCFQKVRKAGDNQSEAISSFVVNAGLVGLTLGLSSFSSYGRLAYLGAREAKLASDIVTASSSVASGSKMVSHAALGFDIFFLGKGGVDAYQKCSKDLNKLSHHGLNKKHTGKEVVCAENPEQSSQAQLVADYRACVIHTVFAGASSVLLPKPVKKALEGPLKGLTKAKKAIGEAGKLNDISNEDSSDREPTSE